MRSNNEFHLQESCVKWFRYQYPDKIIYAIPNGGSRNMLEAVNLKRSGTLSGVADVHIPISDKERKYNSLFIEFKAGKNKQTESQIEFQKKVEKFGNKYILIYSFDEFVKEIQAYLKNIKDYV